MQSNKVLAAASAGSPPGLKAREVSDLRPGLSVETGQASREEWNSILQHFADANLCQTWDYAATRWGRDRIGHVVLKCGQDVVAAAQVILIKVPILSMGIAYVKWGPLWQTRATPAASGDLHQMLLALRRIYVDGARLLLRVTPWEFDSEGPRSLFETAGFSMNSDREELRTAILDLSHPMDKLRASLSRHWRYNLKQAENNALETVHGTTDDLMEDFMTIYNDMRNRKDDGNIPQLNYLPHVQRALPEESKSRIMLCRKNGATVAGLVVSALGSRAFAVAAATGSTGLELRGSYLLQWKMVEWLKSQDVRCYDLARINGKTHPGTTQFKLGLCGKLGSTAAYLGDFEACESRFNHFLIGASDRFRHFLGKARINAFDRRREPRLKEAVS